MSLKEILCVIRGKVGCFFFVDVSAMGIGILKIIHCLTSSVAFFFGVARKPCKKWLRAASTSLRCSATISRYGHDIFAPYSRSDMTCKLPACGQFTNTAEPYGAPDLHSRRRRSRSSESLLVCLVILHFAVISPLLSSRYPESGDE